MWRQKRRRETRLSQHKPWGFQSLFWYDLKFKRFGCTPCLCTTLPFSSHVVRANVAPPSLAYFYRIRSKQDGPMLIFKLFPSLSIRGRCTNTVPPPQTNTSSSPAAQRCWFYDSHEYYHGEKSRDIIVVVVLNAFSRKRTHNGDKKRQDFHRASCRCMMLKAPDPSLHFCPKRK
jgi:hypothetical protein